MLRRGLNVITYRLERLLLLGPLARLFIVGALIGLVSVSGGIALMIIDGEPPWAAVWWAFLRMSDPGYLGDDQGSARRFVATVLTLLGYVLFMGSLVATMTQWLNTLMRNLESGLTPIAQRGHVVVVGWTNRTAVIVGEFFRALPRVQRFLSLHDARKLRIVLLLEQLDAALRQDLRESVGSSWRETSVAMRTGSPLDVRDLIRVDVSHAAAVLVPADDMSPDAGLADAQTIKLLMSIAQHLDGSHELPVLVTELFDPSRLSVARRAYPGPLEIVCSDRLIGRLLALCVLHPGLASGLEEILTHGRGSEIHVVAAPELTGQPFSQVRRHFDHAICLGSVVASGRSFEAQLCPDPESLMAPDSQLVVVARSAEAARPAKPGRARAPERLPALGTQSAGSTRPREAGEPPALRVLIIGWNDQVPDLVRELDAYNGRSLCVDVLSSVPRNERAGAFEGDPTQSTVRQFEGNIAKPSVIARQLAQPYDRVLLVASDRLASGAQADARTALIYLLVSDAIARLPKPVPLVVELMDVDNRSLVEGARADVLVSPLVIGRVLAHVTLRRELRSVYDELFDAQDAALEVTPPGRLDLALTTQRFDQLSDRIAATGSILLGWVEPDGGPAVINPPPDSTLALTPKTDLLLLSRREAAAPEDGPPPPRRR